MPSSAPNADIRLMKSPSPSFALSAVVRIYQEQASATSAAKNWIDLPQSHKGTKFFMIKK
jgi:hypothetical protein